MQQKKNSSGVVHAPCFLVALLCLTSFSAVATAQTPAKKKPAPNLNAPIQYKMLPIKYKKIASKEKPKKLPPVQAPLLIQKKKSGPIVFQPKMPPTIAGGFTARVQGNNIIMAWKGKPGARLDRKKPFVIQWTLLSGIDLQPDVITEGEWGAEKSEFSIAITAKPKKKMDLLGEATFTLCTVEKGPEACGKVTQKLLVPVNP